MALFLGVHDFGTGNSETEIKNSWANYNAACSKRGCQAVKVHYNAEQGKAFCLTEAASADKVKAAHNDINLALADLVEVKVLE